MINLNDYKPRGILNREIFVVKTTDKIAPRKITDKPDICDHQYYHVKLTGLILSGAEAGIKNVSKIGSVIPSVYIHKTFRRIKGYPLLQFIGVHHNYWLINYQSILDDNIKKCDGNILLNWMGCSNINDAIELNWEGSMPLKIGGSENSVVLPDIVQMRKVLYGTT